FRSELLVEPEEGKSYINPVFSSEGQKIAFIVERVEDEQPFGELKMIDLESGKMEEITNEGNHITEVAFSPNGDDLYFLQSSVYENYSPIASERPHGFDIFHIDIITKEVEQITIKDEYSMTDLTVTPDGNELMYH